MIGGGEGNPEPRFAIFGDEYVKPQGVEKYSESPRRSVEFLRHDDLEKSFYDPIACLGPQSPRLPMPPVKYAADDGETYSVTRYEAMPAGGNTFVPGFKREDYGACSGQYGAMGGGAGSGTPLSQIQGITNVEELLDLSPEDLVLVELRAALALALQRARARKRLTQDAAAERIGTSQAQVSKMESGSSTITIDRMIRALAALGLSRAAIVRAMSEAA